MRNRPANSSNAFNGAVTATVIEVLPNGFLVVSGEKHQSPWIKAQNSCAFPEWFNPDTITIGNVVNSTKIADARVEYRTNSKIDAAEITSVFARFFLSLSAL